MCSTGSCLSFANGLSGLFSQGSMRMIFPDGVVISNAPWPCHVKVVPWPAVAMGAMARIRAKMIAICLMGSSRSCRTPNITGVPDNAQHPPMTTTMPELTAEGLLDRVADLGRIFDHFHAGRFEGLHFFSCGAFAA